MRTKQALLYALFCWIFYPAASQEIFTEYQILPVGGKLQLEQVLETQLELPSLLLTKNFSAAIKVNFNIDSAGQATDLRIEGATNNVLRQEITRLMCFYRFHKTNIQFQNPQPYSLVFDLSYSKYNRYIKQKNKTAIKQLPPADSTFLIFSRADKSPVYFRNGDEGLSEYILTEIDYPEAARRKSIQGTVLLDFVVETNGFVTSIEPRSLVAAGCTDEAIRLIRNTRWKPATINGKAVRYKMSYPITFSLVNRGREIQPASAVGN